MEEAKMHDVKEAADLFAAEVEARNARARAAVVAENRVERLEAQLRELRIVIRLIESRDLDMFIIWEEDQFLGIQRSNQ